MMFLNEAIVYTTVNEAMIYTTVKERKSYGRINPRFFVFKEWGIRPN